MLLRVIADDFTGAGDIADTLAKGWGGQGGLRATQYPGVPGENASIEVKAGVVSLKSRSIPANEAVRQFLEAPEWLKAQGCRQSGFKGRASSGTPRQGSNRRPALQYPVLCPAGPG